MSRRKLEIARQNDIKKQVHVGAIVKVEKFDEQKMTVDVQPLSKWENDGNMETPPQVLSVPVMCFCGGGFLIHPWYESGDVGVIVYIDHDIDKSMQSGDIIEPNTGRQHSTEDAVFVGGLVSGKTTVSGVPKGAVTISTIDGAKYISLSKDKISIKGDVEIDGNVTLKDMKSDAVASYNSHVHDGVSAGGDKTKEPV